jgi:hypothetical protein
MLPKRGDAGRAVGRLTVYPQGSGSRTWVLRQPMKGGVLLAKRGLPRVEVAAGGVRVTAVPKGIRLVKLTLYTRDATSPKALVGSGRSARLAAAARTRAGTLLRAEHLLAARPR